MSKETKSEEKTAQDCYSICNKKYGGFDPKRIFCKKGCDSDEETLFSINKINEIIKFLGKLVKKKLVLIYV